MPQFHNSQIPPPTDWQEFEMRSKARHEEASRLFQVEQRGIMRAFEYIGGIPWICAFLLKVQKDFHYPL